MRRACMVCACLMLWLMCACGWAAAESACHALNEKAGLQNADVIGWLEIPGAELSLPIMRHPQDDAYYAKHDAEGKEAAYGALYVQAKYNAADFTDPVTLIYGSSAIPSAPFGRLQELYSGSFEQCRSMLVHTPEGTREYVVFAAVPFDSIHILHYYDFRNGTRYKSFFDDVFSVRALGMHLVQADKPAAGQDQVLILSTSVRGDKTQRYLVMAKLVNQAE